MIGSVKIANTEFTAVSVIFRATFPFDKWLNKFAVAPPGDAARSISPTASSAFNPNDKAMPKHIKGKSSIWQIRPMITAFGYLTTRVKSSVLRLRPRPSIIIPRAIGRNTVASMSLKFCFVKVFTN
jgi:hypothetical protein